MPDHISEMMLRAEGEGPSPEFVAALRQRVLVEAGEEQTQRNSAVLIDLNDAPRNDERSRRRSQIILAAAAVLVVLGLIATVLVQQDGGFEPISPPEKSTTLPAEPEPSIAPPAIAVFESSAVRIDQPGELLGEGAYRIDELGTPFTFVIDEKMAGQFVVPFSDFALTSIADRSSDGTDDRTILFLRASSFVDPAEPNAQPTDSGEALSVRDVEAWLDGAIEPYLVSNTTSTTLGGRSAVRFDLQLTDDACEQVNEFCVVLTANNGAAAVELKSGSRYRFWIVDQADEDPLVVYAGVDVEAEIEWFGTAERLLATVAFGETQPNPVLALSANATALPYLGGVRVDTSRSAVAFARFQDATYGRLTLDEWAGGTEFLTNPRSAEGNILATADEMVISLASSGADIVEGERTNVAGYEARVFDIEGDVLRPGLWFGGDEFSFWRQPRKARMWVIDHPERGLLAITAEGYENVDFSFPAALEQTEAILSSIEFIEAS